MSGGFPRTQTLVSQVPHDRLSAHPVQHCPREQHEPQHIPNVPGATVCREAKGCGWRSVKICPPMGPRSSRPPPTRADTHPSAPHQALPTPAWGMDIAAGRQASGTDARDTLPGPTPRPTAPRAHEHHRDAPTLRVKEHRASGLCRAWPRARPQRPRRCSHKLGSPHRASVTAPILRKGARPTAGERENS